MSKSGDKHMRIALIDNYDSFTYNLYDYLCRLGVICDVYRNDKLLIKSLEPYQAIVLSPGPKRPENAGLMMDIINTYYNQKPILGVCLGHQGIGLHFGAALHHANLPVHGKSALIRHSGNDIFLNIESPMQVMRYHSLILKELPDCLQALAFTVEGELMAMRHRKLPIWGVQFHPESILTPSGLLLIKNWLILAKDEISKLKKST